MFRTTKTQEVKFWLEPRVFGAIPEVRPATKFLPEYFRKMKPQLTPDPASGTIKRCVPFLDALSMGYIIPLWSDVFIHANNGEINIKFPDNFPMESGLDDHSTSQFHGHPLENKPYGNIPLKLLSPWGIETPKGWSCLFTSPLNHLETRLKILDGVVDTDTYYNQVNFPFLWTGGDGEFVLSRGTPLVHVIPFKRETLTHSVVECEVEKRERVLSRLGTKLRYAYRDMFWHKKVD